MRTWRIVPLVLAAWTGVAAAQGAPRDFPFDRTYKGISISGFDVQAHGLTLTAARDGAGRLKLSGSAGCNAWNAAASLHDDQMELGEIATTRKLCTKAKMTTEEAFLTTLRNVRTWRADGDRLILEGDTGRLLLKAGAAGKSDTKPTQKSVKPR